VGGVQVVTEANCQTIVETLRSIAELMIWGDQHEPRFFEFFLENQVLVQFYRILSQPGARRGDVAQQVLQTLSIMIQNIRNQTSIYFLFSNNQINSMLSIKLDFDDEEVMGYYISFLKAIALKFNAETVQLFLNMDNTDPAVPKSFPLYTEALKFFRHKVLPASMSIPPSLTYIPPSDACSAAADICRRAWCVQGYAR
jgi:protein CLEC16A